MCPMPCEINSCDAHEIDIFKKKKKTMWRIHTTNTMDKCASEWCAVLTQNRTYIMHYFQNWRQVHMHHWTDERARSQRGTQSISQPLKKKRKKSIDFQFAFARAEISSQNFYHFWLYIFFCSAWHKTLKTGRNANRRNVKSFNNI